MSVWIFYVSIIFILLVIEVFLLLSKSSRVLKKKIPEMEPAPEILQDLEQSEEEPVSEMVQEMEQSEEEPVAEAAQEMEQSEEEPVAETVQEMEQSEEEPVAETAQEMEQSEEEPVAEMAQEMEQSEEEPVAETIQDVDQPEDELVTDFGDLEAELNAGQDDIPDMDFDQLQAELSSLNTKAEPGETELLSEPEMDEPLKSAEVDVDQAELEAEPDVNVETDILERLSNPDSMTRLSAAQTASHFTNQPEIIEALIRCLEDDSKKVREAAAAALEYSDDLRVIDPLIKYLGQIDNDLLEQSQQILDMRTSSVGKRLLRHAEDDDFKRWPVATWDEDLDITPLTRLLQDRNVDFRGRAEDLESLEAEDVAAELKNIMTQESVSENVRSLAIYALGRMHDTSATEELCSIMNETSASLRYTSALALAELGDAKSLEVLLQHLKDENRFVRSAVAYALGRLGDAEVVLPLVESLNDPEEGVRHTLWKSLQEIKDHDPDTVREALKSALEGPDAELRKYAAEAVGKLNEKNLAPMLRSLLESENEEEVESIMAIASALVELEDLEAIAPLVVASKRLDEEFKSVIHHMKTSPHGVRRPADPVGIIKKNLAEKHVTPDLLSSVDMTAGYYVTASAQDLSYVREALKNNSMYVRGCAVYQLEEAAGPEAVELLIAALNDRSSYVCGAAAEVIGLRGESRGLSQLVSLAKEASVKDVRLKAIKALGRIKGQNSEVELKRMLQEKDLDIVRYARMALKNLSLS